MFAMWLQSAMGGLGNLGSLALPILFFVVLYFLMIAPNQRKQKKWQEMLGQLKTGDKVTTNGGIRGTVLTVKDESVDPAGAAGWREAGVCEERDCRGDDGRTRRRRTVSSKAVSDFSTQAR